MLNDLILYKKYVELMHYVYKISIKYPKSEKSGIVINVKIKSHKNVKVKKS